MSLIPLSSTSPMRTRIFFPILALSLLLAPTVVRAQTDEALRRELLEMARVDQEVREGVMEAVQKQDTAFLRRMVSVDSANAKRLGEILDAHGWPGASRVGRDGARAAWLLAQHGPDALQKRALALMQAAAPGEVDPADLALLTDRVRVDEGKLQLYGSQFSIEADRIVPKPIEDPDRVDERRAAAGLPPLAEYYRLVEQEYGVPVVRPEEAPRHP
jgi:hypothetical protein